jgi:hypothetical protein
MEKAGEVLRETKRSHERSFAKTILFHEERPTQQSDYLDVKKSTWLRTWPK